MGIPSATSNHQLRFQKFCDLHRTERPLILPNIWDPLGALLLQNLGYPAVATASASVAFANGYDDGEQIPFPELLQILTRITRSVSIPVSADVESGFANGVAALRRNIKRLAAAGVVGINFEDTGKSNGKMLSMKKQCRLIEAIRETSEELNLPLFINARCDAYLRMPDTAEPDKIKIMVERGKAYKSAGAHGFFAIMVQEASSIAAIVNEVGLPVNVSLLPGTPPLSELKRLGVARVSLGPGFLKVAVRSMKEAALHLMDYESQQEIANNPISTQYLRDLVLHKS